MPGRSVEWSIASAPSAAIWTCWPLGGAPFAPTRITGPSRGTPPMPSFLGDGLIFEELLPLHWLPGQIPQGMALARLNADNQQLLGAESSLDEVRISEALKDESPALVHELQRLEFKLNILLRLTAEIAVRHSALPPLQRVRLSSSALEWFGAETPAIGSTGLLALFI